MDKEGMFDGERQHNARERFLAVQSAIRAHC